MSAVDLLISCNVRSGLIAIMALALAGAMRNRPASERASLLRLATLAVLLGPTLLLLPALPVLAPAPLEPVAAVGADHVWMRVVTTSVGAIYAFGVSVLLIRLGFGVGMLARWTRRAKAVSAPLWRLDNHEARVLRSVDVEMPMSWGWPRAVILIDDETFRRPQDARAVLAHEVAHVRRHDWLFLVLARVAGALFWVNPLVWALVRASEAAAEQAADQEACGVIDPPSYAQSLINCARHQTSAPANAMSAHFLTARVQAVLGDTLWVASERRWRRGRIALFVVISALAWVRMGPGQSIDTSTAANLSDDLANVASERATVRIESGFARPLAERAQGVREGRGAKVPPVDAAASHLSANDVANITREQERARSERRLAARHLEQAQRAGDERTAQAATGQAIAAEGRALAAEGRAMAIDGRAATARELENRTVE